MLIRRLADCPGIIAADGTRLFELLHPARSEARIGCSLAFGQLGLGRSSLPHKLRQAELYYILRGRGVMHVGAEQAEVRTGHAVYVPPGAVQWLENTGWQTMKFLCIVDPAWTAEGEHVVRPKSKAKSLKSRA